ncbi:MAG: phosphatidate cytidylyltransferase, partial [Gammaproteobacteria bacterium]|nr:phosphatidate cytidylyltransferase [Gammaproteobacteria bacterium]
MLRTRLISAIVMIPLVVYGVLYLSTDVFMLVLAVILLAGVWEWGRLAGLQTVTARLAYMVIMAGLFWTALRLGLEVIAMPLLLLACAWWLCALIWLTRPKLCAANNAACVTAKLLAGVLVCVPAWAALTLVHGAAEDGPRLVLILLVMVWLADSGAYFAGRYLGKHKLAPVVSPGKTWEGVYGGLLASVAFAGAIAWLLLDAGFPWTVKFMLAALVAMMFSVV